MTTLTSSLKPDRPNMRWFQQQPVLLRTFTNMYTELLNKILAEVPALELNFVVLLVW